MITDTEALVLRPRVRSIAVHFAKRWGWHQDPVWLDDLEQEAWVAILRYGPAHPRVWWEVQNAVQDAIARWLWGVTRGQRPRFLTTQVSIPEYHPSTDPSPLDITVARQAVRHEAQARQIVPLVVEVTTTILSMLHKEPLSFARFRPGPAYERQRYLIRKARRGLCADCRESVVPGRRRCRHHLDQQALARGTYRKRNHGHLVQRETADSGGRFPFSVARPPRQMLAGLCP